MSRKTAIIEDFDDDTDLPLPSQPLPNTGARGPLLEEIISDDEYDLDLQQAGPASPSTQSQFRPMADSDRSNLVSDITPYKTWSCIYPIYIDAKRAFGTGQRRIARSKSVWWPLSKDIAEACIRLNLGSLHEVQKAHPRDWENPGRVRVLWKKDGRLLNPAIKSKKQLLENVAAQIQILKPENTPKLPYNTSPARAEVSPPTKTPNTSASSKGKQPATTKAKIPAVQSQANGGRRLPVPPEPHPPLSSRVSAYSPAVSTGVLIETVKAGMSAQERDAAVGPGTGTPGAVPGAQKGKRKVVRVRG